MAYCQNPGRDPMQKTGNGIPSSLLQREFGKTTVEEVDGMRVSTTPYTDKGTPGSPGKPKFTPEGNKAYAKLTPEQRKAQDAKYNLGKPDTKGKIVSKSVVLNPRGIKPVSFPEPKRDIVVKSKPVKEFSLPIEEGGYLKKTGIGKIKKYTEKAFRGIGGSGSGSGNNFNPGCFTGKN
jgi:hypothetical protein